MMSLITWVKNNKSSFIIDGVFLFSLYLHVFVEVNGGLEIAFKTIFWILIPTSFLVGFLMMDDDWEKKIVLNNITKKKIEKHFSEYWYRFVYHYVTEMLAIFLLYSYGDDLYFGLYILRLLVVEMIRTRLNEHMRRIRNEQQNEGLSD